MRSHELTKVINLVNHPIRIKILTFLFMESLSYSDLLKKLELESTGKFSFHLDKLSPLIHKDENGNYELSEAGIHIHSLVESLESEALSSDFSYSFPEVEASKEPKPLKEVSTDFLSHRNFFLIFYAVGVLIYVTATFTYDFVNFAKYNEILWNSFALMMVFMLFGAPLLFFFLYFLHHRKRLLSSHSFILGLSSFLILNITTLFFLSECNNLFLDIVKSGWYYYEEQPKTPLEAIVISLRILLFYEFPEYRIIDEFNVGFTIYLVFWFIFYFLATLLVICFTKRTSWTLWKDPKLSKVDFLPERLRFVESKFFWSLLAILYFFLMVGFDDSVVPSMPQLLPILPTLSISALILRRFSQSLRFTKSMKVLLFILILCPILSLNILTGFCQAISLTGYTVMLQKLVQYNKASTH
jgi:hypothetical protein